MNHYARSISTVQSLSCVWLWPHILQHARLPCPSPTARTCLNSCLLSWWYHPTISYSVIPFSSCLKSFTASRSFQMSQFFASGGQSFGVSTSASVLPMNIQDWFPLGLTGGISLQSKGLSRSSPTPQFKSINSLALSFLYSLTLISIFHIWKNHSFNQMDLCRQSNARSIVSTKFMEDIINNDPQILNLVSIYTNNLLWLAREE